MIFHVMPRRLAGNAGRWMAETRRRRFRFCHGARHALIALQAKEGRMRFWMMAAAMLAAIPAQAQEVTLEPAQGVTLHVGTDGAVQADATGHAEVLPFDGAFLKQVEAAYASGQELFTSTAQDAPPIAREALTLRFIVLDGKATMLALENGYDEGLVYRATIEVKGRSQPTDVCLVLPGKRGYEHWPYAITKITLHHFSRVHWSDGDPLPCA
jgi:hypothetical protein